jgi:hypothetical protein
VLGRRQDKPVQWLELEPVRGDLVIGPDHRDPKPADHPLHAVKIALDQRPLGHHAEENGPRGIRRRSVRDGQRCGDDDDRGP